MFSPGRLKKAGCLPNKVKMFTTSSRCSGKSAGFCSSASGRQQHNCTTWRRKFFSLWFLFSGELMCCWFQSRAFHRKPATESYQISRLCPRQPWALRWNSHFHVNQPLQSTFINSDTFRIQKLFPFLALMGHSNCLVCDFETTALAKLEKVLDQWLKDCHEPGLSPD